MIQILKNIFCIPLGVIGGFICGSITAFSSNILYKLQLIKWIDKPSLLFPLIVFLIVGKIIIEKINPLKLNRYLIAYFIIFILIGLLYFWDDKFASITVVIISFCFIFYTLKKQL